MCIALIFRSMTGFPRVLLDRNGITPNLQVTRKVIVVARFIGRF